MWVWCNLKKTSMSMYWCRGLQRDFAWLTNTLSIRLSIIIWVQAGNNESIQIKCALVCREQSFHLHLLQAFFCCSVYILYRQTYKFVYAGSCYVDSSLVSVVNSSEGISCEVSGSHLAWSRVNFLSVKSLQISLRRSLSRFQVHVKNDVTAKSL